MNRYVLPYAACAALAALVLTGCGTQTGVASGGRPGEPPSVSPTAPPMPTAVPTSDGDVTGTGLVLDDGGGPVFCLGAVAESWPPQCDGPAIEGWDWADVPGRYERSGGVRWGDFTLVGTIDGTRFVLTQPPQSDPLPRDDLAVRDLLATRCSEPDGGWQVVDPATTTQASLDAVSQAARGLEGYGGLWLDQSLNPVVDDPASLESEQAMNDPALLVVNVLVTGDPAAAERELRQIWGGALCVTRTDHSEAELREIQNSLQALPGLTSSGAQLDAVTADVLYDDGSLQAWADAAFGPGLVLITPALTPARP